MSARGRWTVGLLAGLLLFAGCSGRKPVRENIDGPHAAVYRARFVPAHGEAARKFRLLVYAAGPDRLHAEILSAVGTTELILDAGAGGVSVYFVRERIAFVGDAGPEALDALLGVPVGIEDFVQALRGVEPLDSRLPAGAWTLESPGQIYPDVLGLVDAGRRFELRLKRVRPMRADPATLGTGRPPKGAETRPLEELDPRTVPGVETEAPSR